MVPPLSTNTAALLGNKSNFQFKRPPEPGDKNRPHSARNVDHDIQLPVGRIATRPLCCSPSLPTRTQTHIHLFWASHVSGLHTPPPPVRAHKHVSSLCPPWGRGVKLGFNVNILRFLDSVFTPSAIPRLLFCFGHWDILGHGIDRGMVGIRAHIDVQHILKPSQLKNNIQLPLVSASHYNLTKAPRLLLTHQELHFWSFDTKTLHS